MTSLEKLTIAYEMGQVGSFTGAIEALFNPNKLDIKKTATWDDLDAAGKPTGGPVEFRTSAPATLNVDLFFDTYEAGQSMSIGPFKGATRPASVLPYTDRMARLIAIDPNLARPPVCKLRWGKSLIFKGVLTSLTRQFLLFLEDGTPVRALVPCAFVERDDLAEDLRGAVVARKYSVMPEDTLSGLAARFYKDPSKWRQIAEANAIDNPRILSAGRMLVIPKLR